MASLSRMKRSDVDRSSYEPPADVDSVCTIMRNEFGVGLSHMKSSQPVGMFGIL